jgi:hypothetical protein
VSTIAKAKLNTIFILLEILADINIAMTNNQPYTLLKTNKYSGILYYDGCPNDKQTIQI